MTSIRKLVFLKLENSYDACVKESLRLFKKIFFSQIQYLLDYYPKDHEVDGKPFWSGYKRYPQAITFSCEDPFQVQFIQASSNIFADMIGIEMERDPLKVAKLATQLNEELSKS